MLGRLLLILLVASTLGYGTSWAFEGHSAGDVSGHADLAGFAGHASGEDGDHRFSCDHCCHASAHMTAVCPDLAGFFRPDPVSGATAYRYRPSSVATAPPEQPPQA